MENMDPGMKNIAKNHIIDDQSTSTKFGLLKFFGFYAIIGLVFVYSGIFFGAYSDTTSEDFVSTAYFLFSPVVYYLVPILCVAGFIFWKYQSRYSKIFICLVLIIYFAATAIFGILQH